MPLFRVSAVKAENGMVMASVALIGGFLADLANVLVQSFDVAHGVRLAQAFPQLYPFIGGEGDKVAVALF